MKQILLSKPVIAQIVAMIAGEGDQGPLQQTALVQIAEQPAKVVVDLPDEAHVGRNHALADLVAREVLAVVLLHEGPIDRMRVLPFAGRSYRRHDVIAGVESVVGIRGKIGPVRLDIAQVKAPALVVRGLLQEFDRPVGGERGLRRCG